MKYILVLFTIILTFTTYKAYSYEVPQDAVIKVFTKNGKQIGEMSRSEYKVVKLNTSTQSAKALNILSNYKKSEANKLKKSLIFHAGVGMHGLSTHHSVGTNYRVHERRRMVFGLTGCLTKNGKGICGTAISNETFLLGIKKDLD